MKVISSTLCHNAPCGRQSCVTILKNTLHWNMKFMRGVKVELVIRKFRLLYWQQVIITQPICEGSGASARSLYATQR